MLACLILVKTETIERFENIISVTNYIIKSGFSRINVLECGSFKSTLFQTDLSKTTSYTFIEDNDPILHRTHYLNQMIRESNTPYVAIWDSDVIVPFTQIEEGLRLLESGEADFVYPYTKFLDTSSIVRKLFLEDGKIETLEHNQKRMKEMYSNPEPLGGAFFANREAYINSGMENEDFYGWGMEDGERYYRWQRLGYKIKRVPGPLFHLSHGRGINSKFHNPDQGLFKRRETLKAKRMVGNLSVETDYNPDNLVL